ncbi:MAG: response regulator [Gammaproteobacteria bacterium]|nr:response regulator [Gammaproteobacteria bacterium]MBT3967525.1 response regulator [Gammaproteobacteria bacterium]MBT4330539.1 response regulator [Gammaproteobacteria bacterium]MBT5745600.1 response regulator [Gammaproteobacteria bacterium]
MLIAEDTPELQILEQRMMQSFGVTTTIARNGREAVDLAKQQTFDLILMDMQMPIMDGLEATQRIKQSGNRTPIVALTANVLQQHREQFHAAGCDEFLAKPIDRNSLFELLSHHLQPATNREPVAEPSTPSVLIDDELRELFQERSALMKLN